MLTPHAHLQHKTIESVLERGEKLDNLVERSNALSAQSKMFYKTAKKVSDTRTFQNCVDEYLAAKLVLCHHVKGCLTPASRTTNQIIRHAFDVSLLQLYRVAYS